jgi:hypothetical protein
LKLLGIFILLQLIFIGQATAGAMSSNGSDFGKIFAGSNWSKGKSFTEWATPVTLQQDHRKIECGTEIKKRLTDSLRKVLFCEQVASLRIGGVAGSGKLIWAIVQKDAETQRIHNCNAGLIYIGEKQKIVEENPADCDYVMAIEDPSDAPFLAFQVKRTGQLGVVFDGHGAECAGRAVLLQDGAVFKKVQEFYWNCSR